MKSGSLGGAAGSSSSIATSSDAQRSATWRNELVAVAVNLAAERALKLYRSFAQLNGCVYDGAFRTAAIAAHPIACVRRKVAPQQESGNESSNIHKRGLHDARRV